MTLTITPLGRDVLRIAPFPAYIGIPVISDLAKAKDLLAVQEQPDRGLTPDELDRLDTFLFNTDTHHVLSWPRGSTAWKKDRPVLEKLEARGLIRLISKNVREMTYQLTDTGRTICDNITIDDHNKTGIASADTTKKLSKARMVWADLNQRQQVTLRAIYDADQVLEEGEKVDRAEGNWDRPPAAVWRWMLHTTLGTGDTDLKADLRNADVLDAGLGSMFAALEKRGLIQTQNRDDGTEYEGQLDDNSQQWYVFVKLTTLGRAAVRAGDPTYKPAQRQPSGTLKERQWEALEALYKADDDGLAQDDYGNYGGFSWQWTMLRLRDYRAGALAKEAGGDIKSSYPLVKEPYCMVITDFGRQYYEQNHEWYAGLYPNPAKPK